MQQCQYIFPCVIIWLNMYVAVCTPCIEQHLDENSCKVKLNVDTMSAIAECDVKLNKSSTFNVHISSLGYRDKCEVSEFRVECPLENMQSLERYYTISSDDTQVCKERKVEDFKFLPFDIVQPSSIECVMKSISSHTCRLELTIPYVAYDYYAPDNESWIVDLTYFPSHTKEKKQISKLVKQGRTRIKLKDLHPYKNYTILIRWKFATMKMWSEESEYMYATKIGVPTTAPTIPEKNYAHGINGTAIYLQRKPEDISNGPVIAYRVIISSVLEQVNYSSSTYYKTFPGNLRTLFLPLNDGQYHNVSITLATAAGLSEHFTTVYVSPVSIPENKKLKRIEVVKQDTNFTELLIEDLQDVGKLFVFWCWGIDYTSTNVVKCESNIESKEIKSPRESVLIPSPEHLDVNCVECSLHYGAAVQINNITSSLLWDSASQPKVDKLLEEPLNTSSRYYLIIPGVILVIIFVGVVIKCYRSNEGYKIDRITPLLVCEGTGNLQYTSNSSFTSNQHLLLASTKSLHSEIELSRDSLLTSSEGKCSSEITASTDNIRVTPKTSDEFTDFQFSTSSNYPAQCQIILGSDEESV